MADIKICELTWSNYKDKVNAMMEYLDLEIDYRSSAYAKKKGNKCNTNQEEE